MVAEVVGMAKATRLEIGERDRRRLESLARSRMTSAGMARRARILLGRADGSSVDAVAAEVGVNRNTVLLCQRKFREGGVDAALVDAPGRGAKARIDEDERAWLVGLSCQRPCDLGLAAEQWTFSQLSAYAREHAEETGHPGLARCSKSTAKRILDDAGVGLGRVEYYCARRDPDFEAKEHNVLVVYRQLALAIDENNELYCEDEVGTPEELARGPRRTHVVSCDEKPGIQAVAVTSPDLRPVPNEAGRGAVRRDYEYRRLGTLSLLAGIDLEDGHAFPLVSATHKSSDFCRLLARLDEHYPEGDVIRLVLDNHSAHKSKETRAWLQAHPGRFELVFTPTHGSWINMIEGFFAKMAHQMLKGIRVESKAELARRIYLYFGEVNRVPVVHRWRYRMDEIDASEKPKISLAY